MAILEGKSATMARYAVKSSDVISDMRVNVFEEDTEKILWYKERFLTDEEIIENIMENTTSSICWTVHRPKRGWYIRIRAPSFPPGVFIPLLPVPHASPHYVDAALLLSCRTNTPPSCSATTQAPVSATGPVPVGGGGSPDAHTNITSPVHSYPPTPTAAVAVPPPSPSDVHAKLDALSPQKQTGLGPSSSPGPSTITHFVLAPHSSPHVPVPEAGDKSKTSFISRALGALKNRAPSHSSSFTLCPIPAILAGTPSPSPQSPEHRRLVPQGLTPLLVFHDRTPILTLSSTSGVLEISQSEERSLGMQTSFWVTVALTYLEFLGERESYLAAVSD